MAKLIKVYDPGETEKRINLAITESACPGFIEFLSRLPYRTETPLIRGIIFQWFLDHMEEGDLEEAVSQVLSGPGGQIEKSDRHGATVPRRAAKKQKPLRLTPAAKPMQEIQEDQKPLQKKSETKPQEDAQKAPPPLEQETPVSPVSDESLAIIGALENMFP